MIVLLGVGGVRRAKEHAEKTADLITKMDPNFCLCANDHRDSWDTPSVFKNARNLNFHL